ncbi:MAG: HlyC/CorC family transporter [Alphaproteobacteria bacterium]|nr:HlyC/CorC family transporter [Alphaproteobacteria bacterium]
MNDSHAAPTTSAPALPIPEEPRSLWRDIWRRAIHVISPPADADALREVVEDLMEEPLSESGISPAERMLLANIIKLRERRVGDCMVPRADIVAVDVSAPIRELVDEMTTNGYSRIPIYRGTLDDVIGFVHVKDIVPCLAQGRACIIADLLRPVMYVAPSMPASRLLLQMRHTRQHMAMVIDEFGGIDGLVSIEDLVEEIVGEIDDEHDEPGAPPIIARADGTLLADARLTIEAFEHQTGLHLPPLDGQDVDTLGGYVAHLAGRVPMVGENIASESGLSFDVLEMKQSRINRLRIRTPRRVPEPTAAEVRAQIKA